LLCRECEFDGGEKVAVRYHFIRNGSLKVEEPRYRALLHECLERMPRSGRPVLLRTEIRLRRRGTLPGVVGLTTYCIGGYAPKEVAAADGSHTITFYTRLLDKLSDRAVVAVMAHELAHAWLNEHIRPEASTAREQDADMLAEMWGFEPELAALASETEPIA